MPKSSITLFTVLLLAVPLRLPAQSSTVTFFNPGIKTGYTFGPGGGFTFGFEFSYTIGFRDGGAIGAVFDFDFWNDKTKIHLGFEGILGIGLDVGPTVVFESGAHDLGLGLTFFTGAIIMPYYSLTIRDSVRANLNEAGCFLKLPVQLSGRPFPDL